MSGEVYGLDRNGLILSVCPCVSCVSCVSVRLLLRLCSVCASPFSFTEYYYLVVFFVVISGLEGMHYAVGSAPGLWYIGWLHDGQVWFIFPGGGQALLISTTRQKDGERNDAGEERNRPTTAGTRQRLRCERALCHQLGRPCTFPAMSKQTNTSGSSVLG